MIFAETNVTIAKWSAGLAEVLVFEFRNAMAVAAAAQVAEKIKKVSQSNANVRMMFAAAPSQTEFLANLVAIPDIPWAQVTAFHMDDYLGLHADAPQKFTNWLDGHLFSKVPFGSIHRIPGSGVPDEICVGYAAQLSEAPIDIVCLGIGVNGHLAFNDPPFADFNDSELVKVVTLDNICRQQQVDDECFETVFDVPGQAVTVTIPQLISAEALFCVVPGAHKRNAVKAALEGPISTNCPASILRTHDNVKIFLDREACPDE